jgi:TonB dependent receptor.
VIYDNGTATVNGFNGELDYKVSGAVNLFGRIEFKDYKLASEEEPWNLPKFKLTAGTAININNKVKVTGSLLIRGVTYDRPNAAMFTATYGAPLPTPVITAEVSQYVDLSGSVEYKVTKQISIFGRVNNILNSTNQTWLYYPDYGFNIFGGASYSF